MEYTIAKYRTQTMNLTPCIKSNISGFAANCLYFSDLHGGGVNPLFTNSYSGAGHFSGVYNIAVSGIFSGAVFLVRSEEVEVRSEPPPTPPKESLSPPFQPPFGGICNSAAHHNRISNSTMIQSGNTIAAQQGELEGAIPPQHVIPAKAGIHCTKKTFLKQGTVIQWIPASAGMTQEEGLSPLARVCNSCLYVIAILFGTDYKSAPAENDNKQLLTSRF